MIFRLHPSSVKLTDSIEIYCNDIIIEIINLNGISAYDFKAEEELRDFITNVTSEGISKSADDYGVDEDSFYLEYKSVSDNINITESVCVAKESLLDVINLVIVNEENDIAGYIQNETIKYFDGLDLDGVSTNNMSVNIYWES